MRAIPSASGEASSMRNFSISSSARSDDNDRSAMAELRTILLSREPLYARASAVVDTAGLSVDAAYARLLGAVTPVLQNEARRFARG